MVALNINVLKVAGNGLMAITGAVLHMLNVLCNIIFRNTDPYKYAMPVRLAVPAIVPSSLYDKTVANGVQTRLRFSAVIVFALLATIGFPAQAIVINNTAVVNHSLGNASASVDVTATLRTPSSIQLLQYAPGSASATSINVTATQYSTSGTLAGPYSASVTPADAGGNVLPAPGIMELAPPSVIKSGEALFILVNDFDQNTNPAVTDTIMLRVNAGNSGDYVIVQLSETGPDTGRFTGWVQTAIGAVVLNDEYLSASPNDSLSATYTDIADPGDTSSSTLLVDPWGIIFSTSDGTPLDGAIVTLIDVSTGLPATVYGDDGVSTYPSTITSGGVATDSSGTVYSFPAGSYRFPFVSPGTYQLRLVAPGGFSHPSSTADAIIQSLPGAPFSIVTGSRSENFVVNPGPALHIDIPLDPASSGLYITKQANKDKISIGEFVQYKISVSNNSAAGVSAVSIFDQLPRGFRLESGSVKINGIAVSDPVIGADGRMLTFNIGAMSGNETVRISYIAAVSVNAGSGDAISVANATASGSISSNTAKVVIKVENDLMLGRSHIAGRVINGSCSIVPAEEGFVSLRLQSALAGKEVRYSASVAVDTVPVKNLDVLVTLPEVLQYVSGTATRNGKRISDPQINNHELRFRLGDAEPGSNQLIQFTTEPRHNTFGEFETRAHVEFVQSDGSIWIASNDDALQTPVAYNTIMDYPRVVRTRFASASSVLDESSRKKLDRMVDIIGKQAIRRIDIEGHADERQIRSAQNTGFADNEALSKARAESVGNYLKNALNLPSGVINIKAQGVKHKIQYDDLLQDRSLTREEQLSLNRRVEVVFELVNQNDESRFILPVSDSGTKQVQTTGSVKKISDPDLGLDKPGVAGVRLYLEDGRFVISDEKGMFHFEGLKPGTHLIQLDEASLPDHLEVYPCENNTRIAGTPHSRFVDTQGGTLWRADFHVREKPAHELEGDVGIQLHSRHSGNAIEYTVSISGNEINFSNRKLIIRLPDMVEYIAGTTRVDGKASNDPEQSLLNRIIIELGDAKNSQWRQEINFNARIKPDSAEGEYPASAQLLFDTRDGVTQGSDRVENTLLNQTIDQQKLIYQANYSTNNLVLDAQDVRKLDSVVDFLRDKRIRHLLITAHTDNTAVPDHLSGQYADNYALSTYRANIIADYLQQELMLYNKQIDAVGIGPDQPVADNNNEYGRQQNRRVLIHATFADEKTPQVVKISSADSGLKIKNIYVKKSLNPADNRAEKTEATPEDGIINIHDGDRVADAVLPIILRLDTRLVPVLKIDGREITSDKIGTTINDKTTGRSVYHYIGVNIGEKGSHTILAQGKDPFGNARFSQQLEILRTGEPVTVRIENTDGNIADGKTPVRVSVKLLDASGEPVNAEYELALKNGNLVPHREEKEKLPLLRRSANSVTVSRDGLIQFEPVTSSGTYHATLSYNDIEFDIRAYVKPVYREWIMVGLAEGTVGFNNVSGNMQNLENADIEDEYYHDGRLAFYAKGKIKGNYLLTMAYDSKRENLSFDKGLFGSIDPDKYYTLYGDKSQVSHDAPSSKKLYIKIESDNFYAMFGDYLTGLTVTELSRYNRSLTGAKSEYNNDNVNVTVFAAETDHSFVKDELRGDGTSGLYYLSRKNIVLNSEKITIETRDRFKSEVVLQKRSLARYTDYTFDPIDGAIYFREAVYSRDENLNPVYIIADYEVKGSISNEITAGGRIAYKTSEQGPVIGATIIDEGTAGAEASLYAADAKYDISEQTSVKLEYASSERNSGSQVLKGDAVIAEIEHQSKSSNGKLYFREQDNDFGVGQQMGSEAGTRKIGADVRSQLDDNLSIDTEVMRQENINTNARRDVVKSKAEYREDKYSMSGGITVARDEYANGDNQQSNLVTGSVRRKLLDDQLTVYSGVEIATENNNSDYPSRFNVGGEYALTRDTTLFAHQDFTFGDRQDSQITRAGIRSNVWKGARLSSSVENQSSEHGPRTFANMGLTQGVEINQYLKLDFGFERSHTIREPGDTPFNVNVPPAYGTLNNDFTAISAGATYTREFWSMMGRVESRQGDLEDKYGVLLGWYHEQRPGFGMSSSLQYFDTSRITGQDSTHLELEYSVAYRPVESQWIILNKTRYLSEQQQGNGENLELRKWVNNLNANYLFDRRNQLAVNHAIKQVTDHVDGESYSSVTQLLGAEYRHDFNTHWDAGIQASTLYSDISNSHVYSYGVSVGHSFAKNVWLSLGMNFQGFRDGDFSAARYTADGIYIKFRFAFDHHTSRDAMAWWEK